ncbi:H-2 class II histocompatibility antigen, A-F beta chain-like isoform X2 [Tachysurus vachellii]|uniref:H-2 class II histocompatibility antigen, A-F beta chain-like isoform X2 n=1 Tax=Tachysurus vachellii TaxID=175792 RepID=UPI00296AAE33|nr:H-2 class II histocompatibility antigen, A-F beta chain-like isoform X2 [Tachysurus vachellii]
MRLCAPTLLFILLPLFTVNGYYGQGYGNCYYTGDLNSTEFTFSWYFNKVEYLRYNSTTDRYTGFTTYGTAGAAELNKDSSRSLYFYVDQLCKRSRDEYFTYILMTVKPEVTVRSLVVSEPRSLSAMLLCSAYDYHPKGIKVLWLRDGEVVTEGVSSTEELSDGDWYYQTHSYLQYTPRPGENISCVVQHVSLTRPLIITWERHLPEDQRNKLIIGIFLMVLGIVLAVVGFLYYMLRSKEQTSRPVTLELTVSETSSQASDP